MDPNMQNGLPPMQTQTQKNPYMLNNGLGSSQSSRDSSPASRFPNIPVSQLPPSRGAVPPTQLPPGRPSVSPIMGPQHLKGGHSASIAPGVVNNYNQNTPHSSPRIGNFNTSTPIMQQETRTDSVHSNNAQPSSASQIKPNLIAPQQMQHLPAKPTVMRMPQPNSLLQQPEQKAALPSPNPSQQIKPAPNENVKPNQIASFPTSNANAPQISAESFPTPQMQFPQKVNTEQKQPSHFMQQPRPMPNQNRESLNINADGQSVNKTPYQPQISEANKVPLTQFARPDMSGAQLPPKPYVMGTNPMMPQGMEQKPVAPVPRPMMPNQTLNGSQTTMGYTNQGSVATFPNPGAINSTQPIAPIPNAAMNYARPQMNPYQGTPPNVRPPATNQYTPPTSSLHAKRYPQQPYQNYPQQNFPAQPIQQNQPQMTSPQIPAPQPNQPQQSFPQPQQTFPQPQPSYPQTNPPNAYNQQYAQPNAAYQKQNYQRGLTQQMSNLNVAQTGFNKLWGVDNYDLLSTPNILPPEQLFPPKVRLGQEFLDAANCSPEIFRCTMTKIPESKSLLQKSRLPLGVLIHPFKDLNHLPVIQCNTIVRCRACRTYINPFVFFVDTKRWKCNLCYRINELPEEFQYDPVSKSYGDPSRRPEIKSSTIEYIAPSEYMLRPPQPAVYLFLLDISRLAIESGYLQTVCEVLSAQLSNLPGDARTQIGFLAYNSTLHFYSLAEGLSQPHEMTVMDIDDIFLPCPDNLLVNLKECKDLVSDLLAQLPTRYVNSYDTGSALGSALQAAFKMMSSTGGRITVFQSCLPTIGPGSLTVREDPNQRSGKETPHLNPATDFYKRLALDCSGQQIAVDLFLLNSQYVDIATLSGISRFSGGCMYHFPLFKASRTLDAEGLDKCFTRYLTRKIGFEAVMRIRCTRGLAIHTFYGNFFVRSTDLLSLPNVNPDAGFGMQVSIEENLTDLHTVCFQAALLYTSSKGERRIRVHTLCLPVVSTLPDILNSADQQCIVGLLAKMAVDRSQQSNLSDARDAFINVAIDILSSYKMSLNVGNASSGLLAPESLKLLPMYILALLKYMAFRTGQSTRLDDRVFAMCEMKTLPLSHLLQNVYPDLYPIHCLTDEGGISDSDGVVIPQPPRLQLTSRNIDSNGAYLLDAGQQMIILVCPNVSPAFVTHCLGVPGYNSLPDQFYELPKLDNPDNQRLHTFITSLNDEKPYYASLQIMRESSPNRILFLERLVEDRIESALSYNEFLQHIKTQIK